MRQVNKQLLTIDDPENSQNSEALDASSIMAASVQVVASSSTQAGTVKLQASNDPIQANFPANWTDISGASVTISTAAALLIPKVDISYQWLRLVYTNTKVGVQTVTTIADVAGSLNSKYFLLNSANSGTGYYVWLDDGSGVDPAIAGRTGVHVTYSANDTAADIATAIAADIDGLANFISAAVGAVITITNSAGGPYTPASDGNTGFAFSATVPTGTITANLKSIGF